MKISALIITILVSATSFAQIKDLKMVSFTSATRGFQKEITIRKDSTIIHINDRKSDAGEQHKKFATSKNQWSRITKSLSAIKPEKVRALKSPSTKRFSDAAMMSAITLTTLKGKGYTHEFDDEEPAQQLKPLMAIIKEAESAQ